MIVCLLLFCIHTQRVLLSPALGKRASMTENPGASVKMLVKLVFTSRLFTGKHVLRLAGCTCRRKFNFRRHARPISLFLTIDFVSATIVVSSSTPTSCSFTRPERNSVQDVLGALELTLLKVVHQGPPFPRSAGVNITDMLGQTSDLTASTLPSSTITAFPKFPIIHNSATHSILPLAPLYLRWISDPTGRFASCWRTRVAMAP